MGTQSYCLTIKKYTDKKPKSLEFRLNRGETDTGDMEEFAENQNRGWDWTYDDNTANFKSFTEQYSCREVLMSDFDILNEMYNQDEAFLIGLRMGGEQHDAVSRLMQRKEKSKLVEKVLSDALKFSAFSLSAGRYRILSRRGFWRPFESCTIHGKQIPFYIDLYMEDRDISQEGFAVNLSALIALLREPRIVSGIVQGKIKDHLDIVKELLNISRDRARGEDESYLCSALANSSSIPQIKRVLQMSGNDDASDDYSIGMLALYVLGNYCGILTSYESMSGPVSSVEESDMIYIAEKLKELNIDISDMEGGTMESIQEMIEELSNEETG